MNPDRDYIKLKNICEIRFRNKYTGECCINEYMQLEKELEWILKQQKASLFMFVYDMLCAIEAEPSQYYLRGTAASSIVCYLLGFSFVDPVNYSPKLYPEFYFGMDGVGTKRGIEINVTTELYNKIVIYFSGGFGKCNIRVRHNLEGLLYGIDLFDSDDESIGYFNFHQFDNIYPRIAKEERGDGEILYIEDIYEDLLNRGVDKKKALCIVNNPASDYHPSRAYHIGID